MALKIEVTDGNGGNRAEVVKDSDLVHPHPPGLMVYTHPYESQSNQVLIARNPDVGVEMNVDGSTGGTPDGVHNGTDSVYWTASNLSGNSFVFDSTAQANDGTKSIDATGTANNDEALFSRASALTFSGYSAFSGAIYIVSWPQNGTKEVRLRFRLAGTDLGGSVDLSDYIDINNTGAWQSFSIPLSAFALTGATLDQLVVTTVDIGAGAAPNYYLYTLQMEQAAGGGPVAFTLAPPLGEHVLVTGITIVLVDNFTVTSNYDLSYNKFGGITGLTNGILVQRIQEEEVKFTGVFQDNLDLMQRSNAQIQALLSDGTNTLVRFHSEFPAPVELRSDTRDRYVFTVRDDLSGLISLQIRANGILIKDAT